MGAEVWIPVKNSSTALHESKSSKTNQTKRGLDTKQSVQIRTYLNLEEDCWNEKWKWRQSAKATLQQAD